MENCAAARWQLKNARELRDGRGGRSPPADPLPPHGSTLTSKAAEDPLTASLRTAHRVLALRNEPPARCTSTYGGQPNSIQNAVGALASITRDCYLQLDRSLGCTMHMAPHLGLHIHLNVELLPVSAHNRLGTRIGWDQAWADRVRRPTNSAPRASKLQRAGGGERPPLVVVGSVNADLVLAVDRVPFPGETLGASSLNFFPGGKGANQAAAAARLGYPTYFVGGKPVGWLAGSLGHGTGGVWQWRGGKCPAFFVMWTSWFPRS